MKLINKYKFINDIKKIIVLHRTLFLIKKNELYQLRLHNLSIIKIPITKVQSIRIITFDQNFKLIVFLTSDNKINILHRPLFLLFQYIKYSKKIVFIGFITKYQILIVITKISVDVWKKARGKSLFLKKKFLKDNSQLKNFYLGENSLFIFLYYENILKILKIDSNFQQFINLSKIGIKSFLNIHLYEAFIFQQKNLSKSRSQHNLIISKMGKIIKCELKLIKMKNNIYSRKNEIIKFKWTVIKKFASLTKTKISDSSCDIGTHSIILLINNIYVNIYSLSFLKFLRKLSFLNYFYDKCIVSGKCLLLANRRYDEIVMIDYKKEKVINILLTSKVLVKDCIFTHDSKFIILCLINSILKLGKVYNFTKSLEIHNIYISLIKIVSFNNSYRIIGCGDDDNIFIYSLIELKFIKIKKFNNNSKILSIDIDSKDKNFYTTNSKFEIVIGSVKNLNVYKVISYHAFFITHLFIDSFEKKLVVSSMDKTVRIIEYEKGNNNVVVFNHEYPVVFAKSSTSLRDYFLSFTTHRLIHIWSKKNFRLLKIFNLDSIIVNIRMKRRKVSNKELFQIQCTGCEILEETFFISFNVPLLVSFKIMGLNKQIIQTKESFFFNEALQKSMMTKKMFSTKNNFKTIQSSFGRYILLYEKRYLFVFKNMYAKNSVLKMKNRLSQSFNVLEKSCFLNKTYINKHILNDENIKTLFHSMDEDAFKNIFLNIKFLNFYQRNVLYEMIFKNIFKLVQNRTIFNIFLSFILNDRFISVMPRFWLSIFKLFKDYLNTMVLIVDKIIFE